MTIDKIKDQQNYKPQTRTEQELLDQQRQMSDINHSKTYTWTEVQGILRSSYSELLGELEENISNKKEKIKGQAYSEYERGESLGFNAGLRTAIEIIKSKLPKEDKNI